MANKVTLLFIHGSGCDSSVWSEQVKCFSSHRRVVALNLPGHGMRREQPSTPYLHVLVEFLRSEVSKLNRPLLIGHSLGAAVALQLSLESPDVMSGLVLIGAASKVLVSRSFIESATTDYEGLLGKLRSGLFAYGTSAVVIERGINVMRRSPPSALADDLRATASFDFEDKLLPLGKPVMIIAGSEDRVAPAAASRELQKLGGELHIIEGAGHMIMLEQPTALNSLLAAFFSTVDLASARDSKAETAELKRQDTLKAL